MESAETEAKETTKVIKRRSFERAAMGLEADPEDDIVVKEIVEILVQKKITVDRAFRVLKDVRSTLPKLSIVLDVNNQERFKTFSEQQE